MEPQPKKLIIRILEFAGLFALAAFLIRLARFICEVWPVLLVIAVVIVVATVGWRAWRNRGGW